MSTRLTSDDGQLIVTQCADGDGRTRAEICGRAGVIEVRSEAEAFDAGCALLAWSFAAGDANVAALADRLRTILGDLEELQSRDGRFGPN